MAHDFEPTPEITFRKKEVKREAMELAGFCALAGFVVGVIPLFFGLGFAAFLKPEFLQKYTFYPAFIIIFIALIGMKLGEMFTKGKVDVVLHDPQQGLLNNFGWAKNAFTLFAISFIAFSIVGLWSAFTNTFFIGTSQAMISPETQNTLSRIIFAMEPASFYETCLILFCTSLVLTFALFLFRKRNDQLTKIGYALIIVPVSFIMGLLWMAFHYLAYGGQQVALFNVFMFGFLSVLLALVFNSFIPIWVWHFLNNFYVEANSLFADQNILWITVGMDLIIIVAMVGVLLARSKRRRAKYEA